MSLRIFPKTRNIPKKKPRTFILFPFELNIKLKEPFEVKEKESYRLIKAHLEKFKKPYVATSHGKDSVVMCHLIVRACKELDIPKPEFWLNNTLNIYKEEPKYWTKINKFLGIEKEFKIFVPPKLPNGKQATVWSIADMFGHLPNFRHTYQKAKGTSHGHTPECCDWLKKKSINDFMKDHKDDKYDCNFVGTRATESQIRRLGVLQRCRSYFVKFRRPYAIQTVTPLSYWTSLSDYQAISKGYHDDVAHYFEKYDIPVNPTYPTHNIARMGCSSCPAYKGWELDQAQDPTDERMGQLKLNLTILKRTEPERFEESVQTLLKHGNLNPRVYKIISELHVQKLL